MPVRTLLGGALSLALAFAGSAASAQGVPEPPSAGRLCRVGATGIQCYQEPCPRKGIVPVEGRRGLRPLWSGTILPALRGDEDDQRRVVAAWDAGECVIVKCVIVRGSLLPDAVLQVEQVIGPC